jgi:hypothetical protein
MTAADIDAVYRVVDDARRNFLITDAYHRLSTDMKRLIGPHGSWCTFSTWSSRTIGYFIRGDIDPVTEHWLAGLPAWIRFVVRRPVLHLNRLISRSRHRAGPRLLARGNREIFLEIAGEFARFIDEFATAPTRDDRHWRTYRATITASPRASCSPGRRRAHAQRLRRLLRRHPRARRAEAGRAGAARQHPPRGLRAAAGRSIVRSALSLFPSRLLNDDPADPELLTVRDKKPWALQDKGRVRTWIGATYAVGHALPHGDRPPGRPAAARAQRADLCRGRAAEASAGARLRARLARCAIGSWSRCGTRTTARGPIAAKAGTGPSSATG